MAFLIQKKGLLAPSHPSVFKHGIDYPCCPYGTKKGEATLLNVTSPIVVGSMAKRPRRLFHVARDFTAATVTGALAVRAASYARSHTILHSHSLNSRRLGQGNRPAVQCAARGRCCSIGGIIDGRATLSRYRIRHP